MPLDLQVLTKEHGTQLRALLMHDPLYNLFMIGDLETFGLDTKELVFWGHFSPQRGLTAVAMRYRRFWCFYTQDDTDPAPYAQLVDDFPDSRAINGHPDIVDPIVSRLHGHSVEELRTSYFCRLPLDSSLDAPAWPTRRATAADADALGELYAPAGIMRRDAAGLRDKLAHDGRIVTTVDNERIVSAALTSIESSNAAMIGGVFTPERLRNRGYASAAMTHLCSELISEGKQPCLFYDNPAAGSIYRRLGFEDIGPWHLVLLKARTARNRNE